MMNGKQGQRPALQVLAAAAVAGASVLSGGASAAQTAADLSAAQIEDLVRRSYQYVAMFNVNNKFAMEPANPSNTGGWNRLNAQTDLLDHTMRSIARPNNDTLYATAMIDVTAEPVILEIPAFDTGYASLMVTGYDHYVNIPLSTTKGDFSEPMTMLFYSARTPGYDGEEIEGVDNYFEATGDFLSAVFRIMPHSNDPERLQRNIAAFGGLDVMPLSEFRDDASRPQRFVNWSMPRGIERRLDARRDDARFPEFGLTDLDIYENNFPEVMQFVVNHTTFDRDNELDQALLAALEPLGIVPGKAYDPTSYAGIDGEVLRTVAEAVVKEQLDIALDPDASSKIAAEMFKPKGEMSLDALLFQSVIGPIGQPAAEVIYSQIVSADGGAMNANRDYVVRMDAEELPPAKAFWSFTLYDTENGFFMPNDRRNFMLERGKLHTEDDKLVIYVQHDEPTDPKQRQNWLPAPKDGFRFTARFYGAATPLIDASYDMPGVVRVD
jgi:hypothetical protein